jgi:hypothetical protein
MTFLPGFYVYGHQLYMLPYKISIFDNPLYNYGDVLLDNLFNNKN